MPTNLCWQALWFGGDAARIVGECSCPNGMRWDDDDLECENTYYGGGGVAGLAGGLVAGLVIGLLILVCCCGCAVFFVLRKFF